MEDYNVVIRETLQMTVPIVAESMAAARDIAERNYYNKEYALDASNFQDVAFSTLYPYNSTN